MPCAARPADAVEEAAYYEVGGHGEPYAERAYSQGEGKEIGGAYADGPHGDGCGDHDVAGVSGGAQGVGEGKAHSPAECHGNAVNAQEGFCHVVRFGAEFEHADQRVHKDIDKNAQNKQGDIGNLHNFEGLLFCRRVIARADALADNGQQRDAKGVSCHERKRIDYAGNGVSCNGNGAEDGENSLGKDAPDHEHGTFHAAGDSHIEDIFYHGADKAYF